MMASERQQPKGAHGGCAEISRGHWRQAMLAERVEELPGGSDGGSVQAAGDGVCEVVPCDEFKFVLQQSTVCFLPHKL